MARNDPQVNLRMPEELKAGLEAAASQSGRSLTAEIVARLRQSLEGKPGVSVIPQGRSIRIFPSIDGTGLIVEEYDRATGPPVETPPNAYVSSGPNEPDESRAPKMRRKP